MSFSFFKAGNPVHLAFCLFVRERGSPYPMALAATYSSIRQRTSARLCVHIVVDNSVSGRIRRRIKDSLAPGDELRFYDAGLVPEAARLARLMDGRFSPAIIWRAWLPEYLNKIDRCILLDCDLQVLMDIYRLWSIPLRHFCLAAFQGGKRHPDAYYQWIKTSQDKYFRMGVCLMNLKRIRRCSDFILGRAAFLDEASRVRVTIPQAALFEQSLYNRYFSDRYLPLPIVLFPSNRIDQDVPRRQRLDGLLSRHDDLILDLKGWFSDSSLGLIFWASLLHTSWSARAGRQLRGLKRPGRLQSRR